MWVKEKCDIFHSKRRLRKKKKKNGPNERGRKTTKQKDYFKE